MDKINIFSDKCAFNEWFYGICEIVSGLVAVVELDLYVYFCASTVECKTPLPCIGLSENDSKLYINLKFYEGKIINIWNTH